TVGCICGKELEVPCLSELRAQAGESASAASPELAIRTLYGAGGQIVGGDKCVRCGMATTDTVACWIECEKPWIKGERSIFFWVIGILLFGIYALIYAFLVRRETEVLADGKVCQAFVAMCVGCQQHKLSASALRTVLRREPDFVRLFDKYPSAGV